MRQLITDALIVTGDGATEPYRGDALIDGDLVVHLGSVPPSAVAGAELTIDAGGRVLAPELCGHPQSRCPRRHSHRRTWHPS